MLVISTVGIEHEVNLIDSRGFVVNDANRVLDALKEKIGEGSRFVEEYRRNQVEFNSKPSTKVFDVVRDWTQNMIVLDDVSRSMGYFVVPVSEFGAGQGLTRRERKSDPLYRRILGDERHEASNTISGIHIHLSQHPSIVYPQEHQYNILHALDPITYGITSTSPINSQGVNGRSSQRIHTVRFFVFEDFPLSGQLLDYISDVDELERRDQEGYKKALDSYLRNGGDRESFTLTPSGFCFAPIKKRDEIGPNGTWELKTFETAPLDIGAAGLALAKGFYDRAVQSGAEVVVSTEDDHYQFGNQVIILPSHQTLKAMERASIDKGIEDPLVRRYLSAVVEYARQGLSDSDRNYLTPVYTMIETGENPARTIMKYMRSQGYIDSRFSPEQAAKANIFMRDQHLKSLRGLLN